MAFIETIDIQDAKGIVKEEYEKGIKRSGKVFNILKNHEPQSGSFKGVHADVSGYHVWRIRPFPGPAGDAGNGRLPGESLPLLNRSPR